MHDDVYDVRPPDGPQMQRDERNLARQTELQRRLADLPPSLPSLPSSLDPKHRDRPIDRSTMTQNYRPETGLFDKEEVW